VFNGIAYDAVGDRLFVTGKRWPWVYEVRLTVKP
jgi:glutaminyl-peptide cyclotransferase